MKNAAHPECFHRLSQKDFRRLQEAMDATTKETPGFSVSLLLPCGTEHHWCDLRVRTLWSDRQPEHYVGAVGQLVDPQLSVKKPLLLSAADVNTEDGTQALAAEMRRLRMIFDVVRLVDPTTNSVLELDEQGVLHPNGSHCAAFWDNGRSCANCISSRALAQKTTLNKLEFTNTDMYFVISKYLCLNGMPCVLEMLSKLSEGRWIDANGTRLLLDHSRAENMELFMDPLTNTYARRYFESYRSHLEGMEHVAIIDVDSFKQVNDVYGHQTGDTVLRDIAAAIHSCIRSTDTLIRYPEGVTSDNDGYGLNQGWSFGNQLISYAWETVGTDDYYEEMKAFNESAVTSKAVGFIFDSSPVKSEVAALDSVLAEYRLGLENGELDPEEYLPKFQQALREAGIEKVIAEKQRQLDAWVAAQS